MIGARRRNVLISEPHAIDYPAHFLPYMWSVLKSYWERHGSDRDAYTWLDPIFMNADPDALLAPYAGVSIDVLGLSAYTWNWNLQCAIAKRVKSAHPNCLVVAGGPDPDLKDLDFARTYPFIDLVVEKDGEIPFTKILERLLDGGRHWDDVGGVWLPEGGSLRRTGPAEVPALFDYSPYLDQSAYYERLLAGTRPGAFHATMETNRGCPYACTFCDWGSATMSKVRRFEMARVEAEIDFFSRMKVGNLICADANFGILARDVEIAECINRSVRAHGYPLQVHWHAAKNNPERVIAIARTFLETGVCPMHMLAVQHTRDEVLAATDRANIPTEKYVQVVKTLLGGGAPITVQLILGIPGDSYESWKGCLADLMEWGVHEDYDVYFYCLLPNAPAANPEFLRTWEVETVDRQIFSGTAMTWTPAELDVRANRNRLIVKTRLYSREDWVRMFTHTMVVKALHNASITRLIAIYLRLTHGVPYQTFYEAIGEDFFPHDPVASPWHDAIVGCYRRFLEEADAHDRMRLDELPRLSYELDPSRWLNVEICRDLDRFFAHLGSFLVQRFPTARNLPSVLEYQRQMIIVPSYDAGRGKSFRTEFDWPAYFTEAGGRTGSESLPEPRAAAGALVEVSDRTCGEYGYLVQPLEWGTGDDDARWQTWLERVVLNRNSSAKRNFRQIRFTPSDQNSIVLV
jgi:putative methyltransferase